MRVLVCGGRNYRDFDFVCKVLNELHASEPITEIIYGGAYGVDAMAASWAISKGIERTKYDAEWELYGPSAGPRRNQQMVDTMPDLVVAFPGDEETQDLLNKAEKKRFPILCPDVKEKANG